MLIIRPKKLSAASEDLSKSRNSTNLESLDDFSLMSILDMLDLRDLFKLATLTQRFRKLIVYYYIIRKYRLHTSEICLSLEYEFSMYYKCSGNYYLPIVTDCNGDVMLVSRYFGHLFSHVRLLNVNILFESAAAIHLENIFPQENNSLRLDTAFPHMKKLAIDREGDLKYHHPHLAELKFPSCWRIDSEPALFDFLRLNPQIRSVELPILDSIDYLKTLNELLPSLETLSIVLLPSFRYSIVSYETVRFKQVKHFEMIGDIFDRVDLSTEAIRQLITSIQFDHLESFSITGQTLDARDMIIELILNNLGLQSITINSEFSFEQMSRLAASLRELKDVSIVWNKETPPDLLNRILEHVGDSNNTIEKCTVRIDHFKKLPESLPRPEVV